LNFLSSKNIQKLFLHKNSSFDTKKKVNIILSPEFYWVRTFEIPVAKPKDAVKLLPTLFEDILPLDEYSYYAIKSDENSFICFAYSNDKILNAIKNSNLSLSQVNNIFFAQNEFLEYESFVIEDISFAYQDTILIKIPNKFAPDFKKIDDLNSNIKLSKNKININYYSSYIDKKMIFVLSVLLMVVLTANFSKGLILSGEIDKNSDKIDSLKQQYKLLPTIMQTKSVINKLKKIENKQIKLREAISYLFNFKKSIKKGNMKRIKAVNNKIEIVFENINKAQIKNYIQKKYKIISFQEQFNAIKYEIEI